MSQPPVSIERLALTLAYCTRQNCPGDCPASQVVPRGSIQSMSVIATAARRYPIIMITLSIGISAAAVELFGQGAVAQLPITRWIICVYVLGIAANQARHMVTTLRRGELGIDVLAARPSMPPSATMWDVFDNIRGVQDNR